MELANLSVEALKTLQFEIAEELKKREADAPKVIYLHDCAEATDYHLGRYKHYAKLVTGVDVSKTNGFAFIGDFLGVSDEHLISAGSIVVERCDDTVIAYRVTGDRQKEKIAGCSAFRMIDFIRKLAEVVNQ